MRNKLTLKKEIRRLVKKSLKNQSYSETVSIGILTELETEKIKFKTGFRLEGYERIITADAIRHTIKQHGNLVKEKLRGQVVVKKSDLEIVTEILRSDNIIYAGKNNTGNDCLLYEAIIENKIYYVEEIRVGKKQLAMNTMYKRKPRH